MKIFYIEIKNRINTRTKRTIKRGVKGMNKYTFIKSKCEGLSQCQKCGLITWDCFMYQVKEFENHKVCSECKKHMENNTEHLIKIIWKGFKPKY